ELPAFDVIRRRDDSGGGDALIYERDAGLRRADRDIIHILVRIQIEFFQYGSGDAGWAAAHRADGDRFSLEVGHRFDTRWGKEHERRRRLEARDDFKRQTEQRAAHALRDSRRVIRIAARYRRERGVTADQDDLGVKPLLSQKTATLRERKRQKLAAHIWDGDPNLVDRFRAAGEKRNKRGQA